MRILLLEDERDLGAALQRALVQAGYIVDWVQDSDAAAALLERPDLEYAVGIFDWLVPGLSGIDLLQRLRDRASSLPVLILSARDSMDDRIQGLDAGAYKGLGNPILISEELTGSTQLTFEIGQAVSLLPFGAELGARFPVRVRPVQLRRRGLGGAGGARGESGGGIFCFRGGVRRCVARRR